MKAPYIHITSSFHFQSAFPFRPHHDEKSPRRKKNFSVGCKRRKKNISFFALCKLLNIARMSTMMTVTMWIFFLKFVTYVKRCNLIHEFLSYLIISFSFLGKYLFFSFAMSPFMFIQVIGWWSELGMSGLQIGILIYYWH